MKKCLTVFLALAVLAAAAPVWAADTNTLTVSATVLPTCKFSSATSTLAFGNLDPAALTDATASTTTAFWCTKGVTTDAITAGNGLYFSTSRRMRGPAVTDFIPYSLTLTPDLAANNGPTAPRTLTIGGTILNADYANASAGAYSDTVTLTINP